MAETTGGKLRMGEVYRYARPYSPLPPMIDNYRNYFNVTQARGENLALLDRGINAIREVAAPEGSRRPAILISSSPHKTGSAITPWQDFFDTDNGHIRYHGDNKEPGVDPAGGTGNAALLKAFEAHQSFAAEERRTAVPLLFFRRVPAEGKQKGFVQFEGLGIIERAELAVQYDRQHDRTFANYAFDFLVMSLAAENELLDWGWISARRDGSRRLEDTGAAAPASWKLWIREGEGAMGRVRRRVSKLMTYSSGEQQPPARSTVKAVLDEIYEFYDGRKTRFEALAAMTAERIMGGSGSAYRQGWVTPAGSDGGADFVGRLDIGSGLASAKLVVLGQAKCERPDMATGGNHIARTAARLRRGMIGVYVTTGYFSEAVQREVIEDQYPIVLVNGKRLAEEVAAASFEGKYASVRAYLEHVDAQYEAMVRAGRPEEILVE